MSEPIFYLSNSKLHDWETMCPVEWKAKHIDKRIEWKQTQQMRWGSFFESLAIGGGIGGKDIELTYNEINSVFYPRVKAQAAKVRSWLKRVGRIIKRQEYLTAMLEFEGMVIPIEGTLDLNFEYPSTGFEFSGPAVIDIKMTGDTENEWGKYSWGAPEKMDLSQIIHYTTLYELNYGVRPLGQYWVFDNGKDEKADIIDVDISDGARYNHYERLATVYSEIINAISLDMWEPKNTYKNCSKCKAKCQFERIMPEYTRITI